jgi:hypothetical protein
MNSHNPKQNCSLNGIFSSLHKYRNLAAHKGILNEIDLHNCKILVQEVLKVWTSALK